MRIVKFTGLGSLRIIILHFLEGVKWEDIRPHIQLLHRAENVVALPGTGFIYRTNVPGQITAEPEQKAGCYKSIS